MSELSDFLENKLLDHSLGQGVRDYTSPTTLVLALHTADPTDTGAGAEVANANGYSRQAIAFATAAAAGSIANTGADITFTAAGGNWGNVTHVALWDSATWGAGNPLWHSPLDAAKTINDGDSLVFNAGDITCTLA